MRKFDLMSHLTLKFATYATITRHVTFFIIKLLCYLHYLILSSSFVKKIKYNSVKFCKLFFECHFSKKNFEKCLSSGKLIIYALCVLHFLFMLQISHYKHRLKIKRPHHLIYKLLNGTKNDIISLFFKTNSLEVAFFKRKNYKIILFLMLQ